MNKEDRNEINQVLTELNASLQNATNLQTVRGEDAYYEGKRQGLQVAIAILLDHFPRTKEIKDDEEKQLNQLEDESREMSY